LIGLAGVTLLTAWESDSAAQVVVVAEIIAAHGPDTGRSHELADLLADTIDSVGSAVERLTPEGLTHSPGVLNFYSGVPL